MPYLTELNPINCQPFRKPEKTLLFATDVIIKLRLWLLTTVENVNQFICSISGSIYRVTKSICSIISPLSLRGNGYYPIG